MIHDRKADRLRECQCTSCHRQPQQQADCKQIPDLLAALITLDRARQERMPDVCQNQADKCMHTADIKREGGRGKLVLPPKSLLATPRLGLV